MIIPLPSHFSLQHHSTVTLLTVRYRVSSLLFSFNPTEVLGATKRRLGRLIEGRREGERHRESNTQSNRERKLTTKKEGKRKEEYARLVQSKKRARVEPVPRRRSTAAASRVAKAIRHCQTLVSPCKGRTRGVVRGRRAFECARVYMWCNATITFLTRQKFSLTTSVKGKIYIWIVPFF